MIKPAKGRKMEDWVTLISLLGLRPRFLRTIRISIGLMHFPVFLNFTGESFPPLLGQGKKVGYQPFGSEASLVASDSILR